MSNESETVFRLRLQLCAADALSTLSSIAFFFGVLIYGHLLLWFLGRVLLAIPLYYFTTRSRPRLKGAPPLTRQQRNVLLVGYAAPYGLLVLVIVGSLASVGVLPILPWIL